MGRWGPAYGWLIHVDPALSFTDVFFLLMLLIRPATVDDVTLLRTLIRELAEFECQLDLCVIEGADLVRDGGTNYSSDESFAGDAK